MNNFCNVCGVKVENPNYCINCSNPFYANKANTSSKETAAPKTSKRSANRTEQMLNSLLFLSRFIIIPLLVLTLTGIVLLFIFGDTKQTVDIEHYPAEEDSISDYAEEPPRPPDEVIQIPDFINQSLVGLLADADNTGLFTFFVSDSYSDDIPEGIVISQDPLPNSEVIISPTDDEVIIYLVVSIGPEPTESLEDRELEVRFGRIPLPGREDDNPGITIKVEEDIVLTARVNIPDLEPDSIVIWESSNVEVFEITTINDTDNTARILATGAGTALLTVKIGDAEDRVTIYVIN